MNITALRHDPNRRPTDFRQPIVIGPRPFRSAQAAAALTLVPAGCLPEFAIACGRVSLIHFFFGGGDITMLHLLWYIIVGLIAGFVSKSVMHLHMTLFWTTVLGLVGSILGGFITHLFDRPKPEANYHPAGIIVSILFSLLVLWLLSKVPIFTAGTT
jgi:uncharacterized membrane protein YeaQ/YmgE (transglycosylase-associated protein family)